MENCAVETLSISGEIQSFNFFQRVESVECVPFSPYCSAMIRCSPPVCKYFCVDCMVRFPRGCRDRSLSRKLSGKGQKFQRKSIKPFLAPFFQRFGLPLVLFTRNTWAPVPPFIDAGQSLTALLLRQSSTHGSAFFNTFVCACFFIHTHGWLNLLVH